MTFSAGSDSTLLAYILSNVIRNSLFVTVDNILMPDEFIDPARKKADEFDLKHEVIALIFLENVIFRNNVKEDVMNVEKSCIIAYNNCRI